ncbi:MAG: sugar phosphate isomerase/epimerase [Kiritimatiellae bacterium]|nr:sugar phosphate isomerase/epimerase [Kiritimatiellia bacterium]
MKDMKLKFACADFTFPLLPHDRVLDLIAMLDFEGVDIGLFQNRSHLQPSTEFRNLRRHARALRRKLRDRGLTAADVFLQMDPDFVPYAANHPDARPRRKARDGFLKTLEYACECGSPHVSGLPGVYFQGEPKAVSFERCCRELAWRCEQARQAGVIFSIEAHVGSIVPNPRAALRLVQNTPGLTLTLDYTHFTRRGLPDKAIEPLIPHASHFHARGARRGRLQTSVQRNTINYPRILKTLRATGYRGYVGIEYVWMDWEHCNEVDNLSESILLRDAIRDAWRRLSGGTRA